MQTTVIQASPFALSSPINGAFETQLDVGDKLIAGDVIGNIDGNEIKVPVDGIILSLTPSGEKRAKKLSCCYCELYRLCSECRSGKLFENIA